jgi:hypothetical protein
MYRCGDFRNVVNAEKAIGFGQGFGEFLRITLRKAACQ